MNSRYSILVQSKVTYMILGALAGCMFGGAILPAVFYVVHFLISVFDPTYTATGAPDAVGILFGIFGGLTLIVCAFPLNQFVDGLPFWLLPVNLAGWGAFFGLIAGFVRPR